MAPLKQHGPALGTAGRSALHTAACRPTCTNPGTVQSYPTDNGLLQRLVPPSGGRLCGGPPLSLWPACSTERAPQRGAPGIRGRAGGPGSPAAGSVGGSQRHERRRHAAATGAAWRRQGRAGWRRRGPGRGAVPGGAPGGGRPQLCGAGGGRGAARPSAAKRAAHCARVLRGWVAAPGAWRVCCYGFTRVGGWADACCRAQAPAVPTRVAFTHPSTHRPQTGARCAASCCPTRTRRSRRTRASSTLWRSTWRTPSGRQRCSSTACAASQRWVQRVLHRLQGRCCAQLCCHAVLPCCLRSARAALPLDPPPTLLTTHQLPPTHPPLLPVCVSGQGGQAAGGGGGQAASRGAGRQHGGPGRGPPAALCARAGGGRIGAAAARRRHGGAAAPGGAPGSWSVSVRRPPQEPRYLPSCATSPSYPVGFCTMHAAALLLRKK